MLTESEGRGGAAIGEDWEKEDEKKDEDGEEDEVDKVEVGPPGEGKK